MPRDLLADKRTLDAMPELSRESEPVSSPKPDESSSLIPHRSSNIAQEERLKQMGVRPFAQLLNVEDLDDCDWLEHVAFDPVEAASREKVRNTTSSFTRTYQPSRSSPCIASFSTTVGHRQASSNVLISISTVT
jgi:hypothetical protein